MRFTSYCPVFGDHHLLLSVCIVNISGPPKTQEWDNNTGVLSLVSSRTFVTILFSGASDDFFRIDPALPAVTEILSTLVASDLFQCSAITLQRVHWTPWANVSTKEESTGCLIGKTLQRLLIHAAGRYFPAVGTVRTLMHYQTCCDNLCQVEPPLYS